MGWREDDQAKALARQRALKKPGEPKTVVIDGLSITTTKQPMEFDREPTDTKTGWGQKFKAKHKVEIDGVHRGWIVATAGWGTSWVLHPLTEKGNIPYYEKYASAYNNAVFAFEAKPDKPGMQTVIEAIPKLFREGKLGTLAEQKEQARQARIKEAEDRREAARKSRLTLEASIRETKERLISVADERDALQQLIDRQVLTNFETELISRILADRVEDHARTQHHIEELEKRLARHG